MATTSQVQIARSPGSCPASLARTSTVVRAGVWRRSWRPHRAVTEPTRSVHVPAKARSLAVHPLFMRFASLAIYLVFVTGIGAVCLQLSRHVGSEVVALALTYATPPAQAQVQRRLTLVERRQVELPVVNSTAPAITTATSVPPAPETPLPALAAQMDLAEASRLEDLPPAVRRTGRSRALAASKAVGRSAGEVFGRNFGVLLVASR